MIDLLRPAEGVRRLHTYLEELLAILQRSECVMQLVSIFVSTKFGLRFVRQECLDG
jgi:hypothetical protein